MKKSLIISSLAILLTLSIAAMTVWAEGELSNKQSNGKGAFGTVIKTVFSIFDDLKGLAQDVALTDAQKASIKTILVNAKPQAEDLHNQLKAKHHDLRNALLSATPDAGQVQALSQDIANLNSQLTLFRLNIVNQISQQLTPAQKQVALKDLNDLDPLIDQLKDEIENIIMNSQNSKH